MMMMMITLKNQRQPVHHRTEPLGKVQGRLLSKEALLVAGGFKQGEFLLLINNKSSYVYKIHSQVHSRGGKLIIYFKYIPVTHSTLCMILTQPYNSKKCFRQKSAKTQLAVYGSDTSVTLK